MKIRIRFAAILLAGMLSAAPMLAHAQQSRTIAVPTSKKWQHAETGLIVPQSLAGLPRTAIADSGANELDVSVQFGDPQTTHLTLYIFRPALASVPVWLDRVEAQIVNREAFGKATPGGETIAFTPPHAAAASALRRVYVPGKPPFTATGAAMLPLGEWLVAARLSSTSLDPAALDAQLVEVFGGLGWPMPAAGATPAPAAAPIQPCAQPLAFAKKAKAKKPDMGSALIGAMLAGMADDPEVEKTVIAGPQSFCREGAATPEAAAYRLIGSDGADRYVIALGDAGRTISVAPEFALDEDSSGFAVTLHELDASYVYPAFDKLPAPDKVIALVRKTAPISSNRRGEKTLTINTR